MGGTNPPGSQLVLLWGQVSAKHKHEYRRLPLQPPLARKPYAQGPRQGWAQKNPGKDARQWSRRGVMQPGEAGMGKQAENRKA